MRSLKLYLAASLSIVALTIAAVRPVSSQVQATLPAFVRIQGTTPGTVQTGHSNISGTAIAGQFVGGGAGLTGVDADKLDGFDSTAFLRTVPVPLDLSGNGTVLTVNGVADPVLVKVVSGATGFGGAVGISSRMIQGGVALYGEAVGTGNGVIGTVSGQGAAVVGSATSQFEATFGVYGEVRSPSGVGVKASNLSTIGTTRGLDAYVAGSSGIAVNAVADSVSGPTIGVKGLVASLNGTGVVGTATSLIGPSTGVLGETSSANGTGMIGNALSNSGGIGVTGRSVSQAGIGVFATNDSTTGPARAMDAYVLSPFGIAINAYNPATAGVPVSVKGTVEGSLGFGVIGANNSVSGTSIGVLGSATSSLGYALYGAGNIGASGAKTFRIDHPLDPTNKYLLHYSAEGPEPKNIYDGTVTTNANGYAVIELPDYYSSINRDGRVQLTVVDEGDSPEFVQVKVVQKIKGNTFKIRSSQPRTEVFWRVEAVRNDLWMRRMGAPVEVAKPETERGTYQHPELYGQPLSRGVFQEALARGVRQTNPGKP